jgi:enoyl-CoA hydratase
LGGEKRGLIAAWIKIIVAGGRMSDSYITLEVSNHIGVVTMNRPPVNALNSAAREQITNIFDEITDRDDVRVAILTGAGDIFSGGADLKDRPSASQPGAHWRHNRITREAGNSIRECAKPVIAAINGAAIGSGFGMAAACDIMIASDNAYISMPEINVGLAGGAALLEQFFGRSRMRRMMFTGMKLSADELYRLGVIEASVPRESLVAEAMAIAEEIAAKAPLGIRLAKQSANMAGLMSPRDTYRFEQNFTVELSKTEDCKEAQRAFVEKRKPVFKGK